MKEPALIMDGKYLVKEKNHIFQWRSVYCTAKSLCTEKDICCHPQGILFAETVFLPTIPPVSLPRSQLQVLFKHTLPCKQLSTWMYKPHICICIVWSWSHPKARTYQGSVSLVVFPPKRQEAAGYFACKSNECCLNIYHEMSLRELFDQWIFNMFSCLKLSVSILLMMMSSLFWISTYCTTGNERPDLFCSQTWRYNISHIFGGCIAGCLLLLGYF